MDRVDCDVDEIEMQGVTGPVEGLCVTCSKCEEEAKVFGRSGRSLRRALLTLREDCPMKEQNYYRAEGDDEG